LIGRAHAGTEGRDDPVHGEAPGTNPRLGLAPRAEPQLGERLL
jgi:hypothetical protein